jgi:ABC-type amino acid transport system permease subunit
VILPQAFRISLPGLANSLSSLLKDTSLAYSAAGILDVMGMVTVNNASNFRELEGYVGAAIIFFALCLLLERGTHLLSRHFSKGVAAIPTRGS